MRVTRHNGRSGKNGVYNVKHNDRDFDVRNSEHIHDNKVKQNLYWDWLQGGRTEINKKRKPLSFEQVEKKYYEEHYSDYLEGQNARYIKNRHKEKIRTMDDLLNDKKICPEETILQIGNMNDSVSLTELANIAFEYFDEFKKRYGDHVHILDWALHMDEATPHIHERHVFMAEDTNAGIIQDFLDRTTHEYVCTNLLYQEALGNFGNPDRRVTNEINDILHNVIDGWIEGPTHRFKNYGTQRSWVRMDSLERDISQCTKVEFHPMTDTEVKAVQMNIFGKK